MTKLPKIIAISLFILVFMVLGASKHTVQAAEPAGNGHATIWWTSIPTATKYRIYFKEQGEKQYTHAARGIPAQASNYTINYLKRGVTYWYQLVAVNDNGEEFWWSSPMKFWAGSSSWAYHPSMKAAKTSYVPPRAKSVTTSTTMPNASSPVAGWTSATASWQWQPQAQYYNLYYREAGEKAYTHSVPMIPGNGKSLRINFLKSGVGYYYKVAAVYDGQEHWMAEKTLVWPVEVVNVPSNWIQPTSQPTTTQNSIPTWVPETISPTIVPTY